MSTPERAFHPAVRQAFVLLKHGQAEDAEAVRALLADPDVDQGRVATNLWQLFAELVRACGDEDPADWLDRMIRYTMHGEVDYDDALRRAETGQFD